MTYSKTEELAMLFSKLLRKELTEEQMEVVENNNDHTCCASHDFIDANEVMNEAFEKVMGREFIFFDDALDNMEAHNSDAHMWNTAWENASINQYYKK